MKIGVDALHSSSHDRIAPKRVKSSNSLFSCTLRSSVMVRNSIFLGMTCLNGPAAAGENPIKNGNLASSLFSALKLTIAFDDRFVVRGGYSGSCHMSQIAEMVNSAKASRTGNIALAIWPRSMVGLKKSSLRSSR
jgi:hypothetical protein